jgi:uncharacterized protein (TIGR00251 family)
MLAVKQTTDGVCFEVRVAPRASRAALRGVTEGALKVSLTAPPVDGAANAALCEYLAEVLGVPRRAVEITHGHHARRKTVRVSGLDVEAVTTRIKIALG